MPIVRSTEEDDFFENLSEKFSSQTQNTKNGFLGRVEQYKRANCIYKLLHHHYRVIVVIKLRNTLLGWAQ